MAKRKNLEGTKFLRYFGPLLDALRKLGGSGTPVEVAEQIAIDLELTDEAQNELLPAGGLRYRTNIAWARFSLCGMASSTPQSAAYGALQNAAGTHT